MSASSSKENTSPVDTIVLGPIRVSIFANEIKGRPIPLFKASLKKRYFDNKDWKDTMSLTRDDLPLAEHAYKLAWLRIFELEKEARAVLKADESATEADESDDQ